MHHSLQSIFHTIETELARMLKDLSNVPQEALTKKPKPGAWSVLEVMQHLMTAEEKSLGYVKKKTSYPDHLLPANWQNGFKKIALKFFLWMPIKIKAPQVVNESNFAPDATLSEVAEKWQNLRLELQEFLENVPEEWLGKLAYRHTFAGRLTLDGMLIFFRDHFARHRRQIDRTLKEVV